MTPNEEDLASASSSDESAGWESLKPESLRPIFGDRSVLVGVTGGIAAYKTCTVVSRLAQAGCNVRVVMSEAATRFVTPLTFQALSGNPVYSSPWEQIENSDPQHIALTRSLDAVIVAPCTMDCLARIASGGAKDMVTLTLAAIDQSRVPVVLAPAMNQVMWAQPATQRNVRQLVEDGYQLVGPGDGWQACRSVGSGRMAEPEHIIFALSNALNPGD